MHHHHPPWPKLHSSIFAELKNFTLVGFVLTISISYARFASSHLNPGLTRLVALLPVLTLLPFLPFTFFFLHFRTISAISISWLSLFKLLLLAFGRGPLNPSQPFFFFLFTASLPVKLRSKDPTISIISIPRLLKISLKILSLIFVIILYRYYPLYDTYTLLTLYTCHLYLALDLAMTFAGMATSIFLNLSVEPQFNDPFLATSLRDFWGRRWNVMVSEILHQSIYDPITSRLGPAIGVMASFFISGIMHEIICHYLASSRPTGEVTAFFLLHGICLIIEHVVKSVVKWRPPRILTPPIVIGFVMVTLFWLFYKPLLRSGADERVLAECLAVIGFLEDLVYVVLDRIGSNIVLARV